MTRGPTKEEYITRELCKHKCAFDGGYYPALLNALWLCGANDVPLPEWVWRAVQAQLETAYASDSAGGGKVGRAGGRRGRAKMDRIHFQRWSWAKHWLNNKECLKHFGHKPTRDGAFTYASEMLRGKKAQGSTGAIEDSYKLVEKAIKAGNGDRFAAAGDDLRLE